MSDALQPLAEPSGRLQATAAFPRAPRWNSPPTWLWGLSVLLQVACAAALTSYTFFFVDDFLFLEQARTQSFNLTYLREDLFEHFSPVSRLLDKVLVVVAPGSFTLAHGVELALYASVLVAFALVVRTILGNGWSAFTFTLIFGQSIFLLRLLNWWTATANILPSSIGMLLALGCYLRWRESGSRKLLATAFAAYAVSLLDYETAILFPAYLAAISLLVLERHLGWRGWLATLRRERWAWIGFLALDGAAVANFYAYYYHPAMRPSLSAVARFFEVALFQTFVPAMVGIKYPADPGRHLLVIVIAAVVVATAVLVTCYLRPRAWRCVAAFIPVFLVTMGPVALTRVAQYGVSVGHVIYYQQSLQFMFLILAAFAISPRWSGRRSGPPPAWLTSVRRGRVIRRPSAFALTVGAVAALAAYAALYVASARTMGAAAWQPRQDSAYVSQYLASDKRIRAATGAEPVLLDLKVPKQVLPIKLWPYTTYGEFLALFNPRLRVDEIANPVYVVNRQGRLLAARFVASTAGDVGAASVSARNGFPDAAEAPHVGAFGACVPATRPESWLRIPLGGSRRMLAQASIDLTYVVRVRFRMPRTANVVLKLLARPSGLGFATVTHSWGRGSGGALIPLPFTGLVRDLAFRLPARACVTEVTFGQLSLTGGS